MGDDTKLIERVRAVLADRDGIAEKRMIGGLCFLLAGNMCCGVAGNDLLVRVGAVARDRMLRELHVKPMKFGGRPLAAFVRVEPEGIRTKAALIKWIKRGADFAAALPRSGKVSSK